MALKGDQNTVRALNRRLVLNFLRRDEALSRIDIAGLTGLSPASISAVVGELIDEGLVIEGKGAPTGGGRRPIPLQIDYSRRNAIGFKLMPQRLEAVLTDLSTAPLAALHAELADHAPATVIAAAAASIERLMPGAEQRRDRLVGVGLAMPGLIDVNRGVCLTSHRFGWNEVPIAPMLAERIDVPVWVDNDVNAFAIAQQLFGHGRMRSSVLVLILGTGVGAALVFNGRIHRGARFAAGEIGFAIDDESRTSWEDRFSEPAIARAWQELHGSAEPAPDLALAGEAGDTGALAMLKQTGREIGRRLATMIDLVDPAVVIVGGEAVRFGAALTEPIIAAVREFAFLTPPPIEIDWDNDVWSRGASALAVQQFFDFESAGGITHAEADRRRMRARS